MAGKVRHLLDRDGSYFARIVIPPELRPFMGGKTELRTGLGKGRREALARLHIEVARLQQQIGEAEQKRVQLTSTRVKPARYPLTAPEIAERDYQSQIAFDAELRAHDHRYAQSEIDADEARLYRDGYAGRLSDDELDELVGHRVRRAELQGSTSARKGTPEWRAVAQALCVSSYEAMSRQLERNEGDFTGELAHPLLVEASAVAKAEADAPAPVYLRTLLNDYLKELEQNGKGREARKRWTPVFEDLAQFVGHNDAARITKRNMVEWRDAQLAKLSPKTVKDTHMASVRAVLSWAVDNDRLPMNPTLGVKVKAPRQIQSREKGFRDDEALTILKACRAYAPTVRDNPSNQETPQTTAAKLWASVICAFTGARIVEITQLRKQDVREEGSVPVIRITPDAGSVKTGQYRDVPLHRQLIDLGFLDFVKAAPDGPLFHTAKPEKGLQGARTTSGRLSQWLQSLGVIPEGVSPNHGWRHRFKTIGREAEISDRVLDAIQGHAARTAGDNYGDVTITTKRNAITKLPSYAL